MPTPPIDRTGWTFGQLLGWHLLRGTRPGGKIHYPGRRWSTKAFAEAVGCGDRAVRYWLRNEHLPPEIETVERVLFGNGAGYAEWRLELRRAHAMSWAAKGAGARALLNTQAERESHAGEAPSFRASNIPIRVPTHFMGRDDELVAIETAFNNCNGRVAIVTLHGLRGIGKTTLAAAFAERHGGDYRATWWIRARAEPSMRADLVALGVRLGWANADDKEEPALFTILERLLYEGKGILLIYDNAVDADSLKPYLPRRGEARILVTSNAHAWRAIATPLEIGLWRKEVGADYLIARTGRAAERVNAEALSEVLGGLPLAHEQAAAYCERLGISLANYCQRFQAAPTRLLDDARHAPTEYRDGLTVIKTFALAIDEAAKLNCLAEPLIVHAALLAPEPIPLFLFSQAREKFGEPLASMLVDDGLEEAVAALRSLALVDRPLAYERDDAMTDAIRLHRLVREVAASRRTAVDRDHARHSLIGALTAVYPSDGFNNPLSWRRCALLTPHLLAVCDGQSADIATQAKRADLLQRAASYFYGRAAYSQAQVLFERVVVIREEVLGPKHADTARCLNNLAVLLKDQGELSRARPLFERAVAIWETVRGPEHPDTAASLNNLASLLQAEGDFVGARQLFERALAIWNNVLGPEHPDTATGLSNLAFVLQTQGDFAGARPLFERALAIYEKTLGPDQSHTAASLNNLARVLELSGNAARARPLFERALAIYEKVLGPEHPNTTRVRCNLARMLRANGGAAETLTSSELP